MMARSLYRLLLWAGFPLIFLYLLRRSRKQAEYRLHWGERLGFYPPRPDCAPQPIWLHAVSVGEMRAAAPLVKALRARDPFCRILLTCMTPTGRATAEELYGDDAEIAFLPYDYPGAVRRFLAHFRPKYGLLMETELWPNLLHLCADSGVPVYLANARLSQKSLNGYLKVAALVRPAVARLAGVLAQSPADAERLQCLGAQQVEVMGNLKFDNQPSQALIERGQSWKTALAGRQVLLFASSREGEEVLLLQAMQRADGLHGALLLLVPRHPQRFDEVAELLAQQGLSSVRRSQWQGEPLDPTVQVLLGDSMGEMAAWYALADVVLMGGSILPFGSQNLIEPCALGVPVLLGPSTFNFAQACALALECGAARQVADVDAMLTVAIALLADQPTRSAMGQAGRDFALAHRGATQRMVDYLLRHAPN